MEPVRAVIFDYGGVISTPLTPALLAAAHVLGVAPPALARLLFGTDDVENPLGGDVVDGAPTAPGHVTHDWHRLEVGESTFDEYVEGVRARAREQAIDFSDEVLGEFLAALAPGTHWRVVHEVRALRDRGLRLALLTNNVREFGETWRDTFPVDELFPVVVDSSEVGLRKPDVRIYELACDRIEVAPHESVFVDDNAHNVEAARSLGMEAVHFRDPDDAIIDIRAILDRRGIAT